MFYPICTVWCCSEHYLWLWVVFWWWSLGGGIDCSVLLCYYIVIIIVIVQSFLSLLKLHKPAVGKPDLLRVDLTRCHDVLHYGLNLRQNIPLSLANLWHLADFMIWEAAFSYFKHFHEHSHVLYHMSWQTKSCNYELSRSLKLISCSLCKI